MRARVCQRSHAAGFEDGKRSQAKEYRWSLKAGKGKEIASFLGASRRKISRVLNYTLLQQQKETNTML